VPLNLLVPKISYSLTKAKFWWLAAVTTAHLIVTPRKLAYSSRAQLSRALPSSSPLTRTHTCLPFVSMHVPVITLPIHCSNFIMLILGGIAPGYKRMHSSLSCPSPRLSHFVPAYPHRAGVAVEPQEPKNAAVVQFRPASTA